MLQRSPAAVPVPAALLLAERVAAVRLPVPSRRRRPARRRPARRGPDLGRAAVQIVTGRGIEGIADRLTRGAAPAHLIWIAAAPRAAFGDAFVDRVLAAPCDVTVWDTTRFGEPDLLRLAYAAYVSAGAAGVVCLTPGNRSLARALRRRGIPASASAVAPTL